MISSFLTLILICDVSNVSPMDIDLGNVDLPNNVLKFGYGINYKYMGKVSHSFGRFYIVTKFELPKVVDLKFKPNSPRKEFSMGHDKNRLQRSLCDFEWHNSKNAKNS